MSGFYNHTRREWPCPECGKNMVMTAIMAGVVRGFECTDCRKSHTIDTVTAETLMVYDYGAAMLRDKALTEQASA